MTAEALAYARWNHHVGSAGAGVTFDLPDGRTIHHDQVEGVLNRLVFVPSRALTLIHRSDRDYVHQELNAFYLSWLNVLPGPVINTPTPQGLCGRMRYWSEWCQLAAVAGLSTDTYSQSSRAGTPAFALHARAPHADHDLTGAIVVGGKVVGPVLPDDVQDACVRFAALAGIPLLGIEFSMRASRPWVFAGVTPLPELRSGGPAMVEALADALSGAGALAS